jgi:Cft2 family RNA processing exonuclease
MQRKTMSDFVTDIIKANPGETQRGWELLAWKAMQSDKSTARAFFNYGIAAFCNGYWVTTAGPDEIAVAPALTTL